MSKQYYPVISRFFDRQRKVYVDPKELYSPPSPEVKDYLVKARCLRDVPVSAEEVKAAEAKRAEALAAPKSNDEDKDAKKSNDEDKDAKKGKGKK